MSQGLEIVLQEIRLLLLPEKAVFIPDAKTLLLADLHLGKGLHFRKEGIFIPPADGKKDLSVVHTLIGRYAPHTVVFLGDLFHSRLNSDWHNFTAFMSCFPSVHFVLTKGNHDILPQTVFADAGLELVPEYRFLDKAVGSHRPLPLVAENELNIAGHIHPGCTIRTPGRQSFRLPCFHVHRRVLLLPAFGELTGLCEMPPHEDARFFPVLGNKVIEWDARS